MIQECSYSKKDCCLAVGWMRKDYGGERHLETDSVYLYLELKKKRVHECRRHLSAPDQVTILQEPMSAPGPFQ